MSRSARSDNISFVIEQSLCHGCGACEVGCPEDAIVLELNSRQGIYLPRIVESRCTSCSVCVDLCSGWSLDLTAAAHRSGDELPHHLIGPHTGIFRAYSTNPERRRRGASGAIVTELAAFLLESGQVDGVLTVRMNAVTPTRAEYYLARSVGELVPSQKSKYCPVPLGSHIKEIIRGKLSFPPWFGNNSFHASHRSNLLRKNKKHYSKFKWKEPQNIPYIWPTKIK